MNAMDAEFDAEEDVSLDKTLHILNEELEAARVASMQALVLQMQIASEQTELVSASEFADAVADLSRADDSLRQIHAQYLKPLGIELPEDLEALVKRVSGDLGELVHILERCEVSEEKGITGLQSGPNFHDLCWTRLAKGLKELNGGIASHFLELKEKEKSEDREKTSKIALEIGKIGRVINMVATNASIEAARVGDAGKGFTVIADEVKTLSTRVSSLSVSLTDRLS